MNSDVIYTFADDDMRARFTMTNRAYRALTIRKSEDGMLSVDVVHVNKSTGKDFKSARRFVWLTLPYSLDRFAPDFARIVRSIVASEVARTTIAVGDVVEFVSEFHGTCTAPVTRVWTNGKYVTVTMGHRTFVRLIADVRIVMKGNEHG